MPSWIPGYRLLEGPEETGVPLRYRGVREPGEVPAWIRVDGFDPASQDSALLLGAIYTATASFDHPLLPRVLDYGSTEVAGRAFITFQASAPVEGGGHRTRRGTMGALAELQVAALDCGLAGVHLPLHELKRLREGARLDARHVPVNEFLAEPWLGGLDGIDAADEARPFASPEVRAGARHASYRAALAYRLATQLHVLLEGALPGDAPGGDADKTVALSVLAAPRAAGIDVDVPRELVRLGLSLLPELRPDLDDFLASRLPSRARA